ncbi:porimin isoform X1 [Emys orbicularis]|uniref:porimin isoform X1 n=1 Tax=Emys orbicularis TaxID=82168 RepID=UPI0031FDB9FA
MRLSAGAASPVHAAALLLLAAVCLSASGSTNTSIPTTITQSTSNTSASDKNVTHTTTLGSTKTTPTQTTTTATQTTTNPTTTSTNTSKPIQSTASVTVTTSKTMSPSSSVTVTPKSATVLARTSRFDVGSFFGGIVLTLGMLAILYVGCKTYHARRGVQYRTIDEHDAII